MWFSGTENYTRYTSDLINAEYRVVSQSGWGVYCSWDGNTNYNIPSYYEQVCGVMQGEVQQQLGSLLPYNFASWQADYVIINLGTNDGSAYRTLRGQPNVTIQQIEQFTTDFEAACYSFLQRVRSNNPSATIVWAYGMLGNELQKHIESVIKRYVQAESDEHVHFCSLPNVDSETLGSRQHPGQKLHINAAHCLAEFIGEIESEKT